MSSIKTIMDQRRGGREILVMEERRTKALEDCADALEGMRQDLTLLFHELKSMAAARKQA
jgi:hypothetical protein